MGATLPRHSAHSKAKVQGARRQRALCPRSETIDTFLPFGCGVPVANARLMVSNPSAGRSAARFDHAYARPCTARFFRLPVAAAERRYDALTAKEGPVDHGKPGERALPLADRAVLLEQAQYAVGTLEPREAISFELPAVAQAESDRIRRGLAFELRAAQHKGLRAHLTRSSLGRGGERQAHHTPTACKIRGCRGSPYGPTARWDGALRRR